MADSNYYGSQSTSSWWGNIGWLASTMIILVFIVSFLALGFGVRAYVVVNDDDRTITVGNVIADTVSTHNLSGRSPVVMQSDINLSNFNINGVHTLESQTLTDGVAVMHEGVLSNVTSVVALDRISAPNLTANNSSGAFGTTGAGKVWVPFTEFGSTAQIVGRPSAWSNTSDNSLRVTGASASGMYVMQDGGQIISAHANPTGSLASSAESGSLQVWSDGNGVQYIHAPDVVDFDQAPVVLNILPATALGTRAGTAGRFGLVAFETEPAPGSFQIEAWTSRDHNNTFVQGVSGFPGPLGKPLFSLSTISTECGAHFMLRGWGEATGQRGGVVTSSNDAGADWYTRNLAPDLWFTSLAAGRIPGTSQCLVAYSGFDDGTWNTNPVNLTISAPVDIEVARIAAGSVNLAAGTTVDLGLIPTATVTVTQLAVVPVSAAHFFVSWVDPTRIATDHCVLYECRPGSTAAPYVNGARPLTNPFVGSLVNQFGIMLAPEDTLVAVGVNNGNTQLFSAVSLDDGSTWVAQDVIQISDAISTLPMSDFRVIPSGNGGRPAVLVNGSMWFCSLNGQVAGWQNGQVFSYQATATTD